MDFNVSKCKIMVFNDLKFSIYHKELFVVNSYKYF